MPRSFRLSAFVPLLLGAALRAASALPPEPISLETLATFQPVVGSWRLAGGVSGDLRHAQMIEALPGAGLVIGDAMAGGKNQPLVTVWEHGDLDVEFDFLVTPETRFGLLLQGRYELKLADTRPVTASRAPGLWQHAAIQFRAPRFDARGKKTASARLLEVSLNGYVVQQGVELAAPAQSASERSLGPLVFQRGQGSVALRNLRAKRYSDATIGVNDFHFSFYGGSDRNFENYTRAKPTRESAASAFSGAILPSDERGVAVFTGDLAVPRAGNYLLRADVWGAVRLTVGRELVITPTVAAEQSGIVALAAGVHPFKLEYQYYGTGALRNGGLKIWVEGPGIVAQQLLPVVGAEQKGEAVTIPVEANDRIRMQRTFVPLETSRRLYATFVGTPQGVHYAYDFESACLIGVWRGGFFDGRDLWHERAEDQQAHPAGPGFTIEGKPLLFQFGDHDAFWPPRPPGTSASNGYRIEANGQPVFLYEFSGVRAEDRIAPLPDGSGLTRTLKFAGRPRSRDMWALLAEDSSITRQPSGGYVVGDRGWYLDWPKDAAMQPTLRREGQRTQLLVRLTGPCEFTYNLVW